MGCGVISGIYIENMLKYKPLDVIACGDLDINRARAAAERHGIAKAQTVEQMLDDSEIEIVVDLTVPNAHAVVNDQILAAGKHVYTEKPFATVKASAKRTMDLAKEMGLLIGCAPDSFLGAAHQTCRQLIDEGLIGIPLGAHSFMLGHGPEHWVPLPHAYYQKGTGPLLDMAPYYISAFVNLLGPIRRVTSSARITRPERVIPSGPRKGEVIKVETPTHVVAILDFESGPVCQLTTSSDIWEHRLPYIELYGSEGTLIIPDPNQYDGPIEFRGPNSSEWRPIKSDLPFGVNSRGVGIMDMAYAIRTGRPHRASGALGFHAVEVMESILDASELGRHVDIESHVSRPEPLPASATELDLGS